MVQLRRYFIDQNVQVALINQLVWVNIMVLEQTDLYDSLHVFKTGLVAINIVVQDSYSYYRVFKVQIRAPNMIMKAK